MFILREARMDDQCRLLELARQLDSINLPTESEEMADALERSRQSFAGTIKDRAEAAYMFCAELAGTDRLVGASMIIAKRGTSQLPHFSLDLINEERYSQALQKTFQYTSLKLRQSVDGPSEVGGLIVDPSFRGHHQRVGRQISWVRFLYMGTHLDRFEKLVIAEIMPPLTPGYGNVFWTHYGGRLTGLTFREAVRLSIRDKEFIRALFPTTPLYICLLEERVRASIAAVGYESRGAVRMLEQAGMRFLDQIDPLDGGPYFGCETATLEPVKAVQVLKLVPGDPKTQGPEYLIGLEDSKEFRAAMARAIVRDDQVAVDERTMKILGAKENTRVVITPLPSPEKRNSEESTSNVNHQHHFSQSRSPDGNRKTAATG